jgi:hypothetical protein
MMAKMMSRADEIARDARKRRRNAMAERVAARLPEAEIKMLAEGFSVRALLLLNRWLDDEELRFLRSMSR